MSADKQKINEDAVSNSLSKATKTGSRRNAAKRAQDDGWGGEGMHGYMKEKERKLEQQFLSLNDGDEQSIKSDIFYGVCIFVNGYTNPSSDHLKQIMADHGGRYQHYYSMKSCTHIIATNLPDSKVKNLKNEKIVHPNWILDSVKVGRRLPIDKYRLYCKEDGTRKIVFANSHSKTEHAKDLSTNAVTAAFMQVGNNEEFPLRNYEESHISRNTGDSFLSKRTNDFHTDSRVLENQEMSPSVGKIKVCIDSDESPLRKMTFNDHKAFACNVEHESSIAHSETNTSHGQEDAGYNAGYNVSIRSCKSDDLATAADSSAIDRGVQSAIETRYYSTGNINSTIIDNDDVESNRLARACQATLPNLTKHDYSKSSPSKSMGKAGDPGFMNEFYSNSRLHHLSMWRSELKRFATMIHKAATKEGTVKRAMNQRLERTIMHIDMDSFFVSVALKEKPELKGKPVAVCHASKGPYSSTRMNSMSEIASCSYEARHKGVRNGMFLGSARAKCPELICVPYYFEKYRTVSQAFYEILASYTCEIEAVSCDEALLDVSELIEKGTSALELASKIRCDVFNATGCTASAGIACNILLARMATRNAKPNGQFHLKNNEIKDFIECQKVSDLPGVGHSMLSKLTDMGVQTCGDLRRLPIQTLQTAFGPRNGQSLYNYSRGLDDRQIKTDHERQSVSAEINYGIRFTEDDQAFAFIHELAKEVHERLKAIAMNGIHITLKLMVRSKNAPEPLKHMGHGICDNISKSVALSHPTDDANVIAKEAIRLLQQVNAHANDIRGMGIQVSKLVQSSSRRLNTIDFSKARHGVVDTATAIANHNISHVENGKDVKSKEINQPPRRKLLKRGRKSARNFSKRGKANGHVIPNFLGRTSITNAVSSTVQTFSSETTAEPPLPCLDVSPGKPLARCEVNLPPMSEIDPDVFNQLPEDVRQSIVQGYQHRNEAFNVKGCSVTMPTLNLSPTKSLKQTPSVAHSATNSSGSCGRKTGLDAFKAATRSQNQEKNDRVTHEIKDYMEPRGMDVLSESLLDPEVMEALPPDIREEVLQSIRAETAMNTRQKKDDTTINCDEKDEKRGENSDVNKSEIVRHVETKNSVKMEEKQKHPALCGKTNYEDVKMLIKSWIKTTDEPLAEDIDEFMEYLKTLVECRKMQQAFLLLKMFKRLSSKSSKWISCWETLDCNFQIFFKNMYGTNLFYD